MMNTKTLREDADPYDIAILRTLSMDTRTYVLLEHRPVPQRANQKERGERERSQFQKFAAPEDEGTIGNNKRINQNETRRRSISEP